MKTIDILFSRFAQSFPQIADMAVEYHVNMFDDLVVTLIDGDKVIYEDSSQSIRNLPDSPDVLTEDEFKREFGFRLRTLMERKHITQKELSELTGISTVVLSNYINGKNIPSFYAVDRIAKALECSVDYFRYLD